MARPEDRVYELQAAVCRAIAHPARLKVLDLLHNGEECVCRLAPQVGVTESNLSQLLAVLRLAGLVEARREGHSVYYRIADERIIGIMDAMRRILLDQLSHAEEMSVQLRVTP